MPKARLPVRETDIVASCLDYLVAHGILCWRSNSGAVTGEYRGKERFVQFVRFSDERGLPDEMKKSMPDIGLVLHDGKAGFIEVKRPGERATRKQENFLDEIRRRGGVGVVVRSVDELASLLGPLVRKPVKGVTEVPRKSDSDDEESDERTGV